MIQPCISLFFHSFSTYELFFLSKGFLPTYGPCWVNLYGSTRQYSLLNENQHLNDGLGEGVSYRGRMLISLRTEVIESADLGGPATVEVCSALPISDVSGLCINAWYIWYCKCIAFCCVLYDGFFVRFSNCSLIKYIALICQACFCSNLKKCIKIQKCSQLNLHIYMLNKTCLQYMKRQCMHDNKFLLCLKIVIYVYLHDF